MRLALAAITVFSVILIAAIALAARGIANAVRYWVRYQSVRYPRMPLSGLIKLPDDGAPASPTTYLKTGDILLFIPYAHGFFNSMLTDDVFSHTAMVVEIDDPEHGPTLYTSEATQGTELGPAGFAAAGAGLVPLLARLKYYSGSALVMQLQQYLTSAETDAVRVAARTPYPYPEVGHIIAGVLGLETPTRHCFQHVAHLLRAAGLIDLEAGFAGISRKISGLSGVPLANGNVYGPVTHLLYDIDVESAQKSESIL